jgi:hypothetical protein
MRYKRKLTAKRKEQPRSRQRERRTTAGKPLMGRTKRTERGTYRREMEGRLKRGRRGLRMQR